MAKHEKRRFRKLEEKLAILEFLERDELAECWQNMYSSPMPPRISRQLLHMALSYGIQQNYLGGIKPAMKKLLAKAADGNFSVGARKELKPGTRLLREWRGHTYEVTVQEKGFLYEGERYRSLTKIADLITGTHISGPVFFGIKG